MAGLTSVQKLRKKKLIFSLTGALLLTGIFLLSNFVVSFLPIRLDTSDGSLYSLSSGSKSLLKKIDDRLIIRMMFSQDLPPRFKINVQYIRDLLSEYRRASHGKIKVEFIDPSQSSKSKQDAMAAGVYPVQLNVIKKDKQEIQEGFLGLSLLYGDKREAISFIQNTDGLEYEISQRIKKLVQPAEIKIGFVTNGKAMTFDSEALKQLGEPIRQLYQTVDVDLSKEIPSDIKSLWLLGPTETLDAASVNKLKEYLENGGVLGLLIDQFNFSITNFRPTPNQTGLETLLKDWGIDFKRALVVDPRSDRIQIRSSQGLFQMINVVDYPYFPLITDLDRSHPATKNLDAVSLPLVSPLIIDHPVPGIVVNTLAQTSSKSWLDVTGYNVSPMQEHLRPNESSGGPFKVGLLLEGKFKAGDPASAKMGRVILFGCSRFIRTDYPLKQTNYALFANLLDWSSQDEALLSIRTKGTVVRPLKEIPDVTRVLIKYAMILALPLFSLAVGFVIWTWNKNRLLRLRLQYQGV